MILTGRYSALNMLIQKQIYIYINWAETSLSKEVWTLPLRFLAGALAWLQKF
jgi:hypothetical protein